MVRASGSKRRLRNSYGLLQQVFLMVVVFSLGYFTASIFDIEKLSHWMTTQVLDQPQTKKRVSTAKKQEKVAPKPKFDFYTLLANEQNRGGGTSAPATSSSQVANQNNTTVTSVPVNKVTQNAVNTIKSSATEAAIKDRMVTKASRALRDQPNVAVVTSAKAVARIPPAPVNHFVVQVAAFKTRHDAEQMKAVLILKGFAVTIVPISTRSQGTWFRVLVGPYPNRALAQKVQVILAKTEHLHGMVRTNGTSS